MDFSYLYMSTEGRIGRQSWWIGYVVIVVIVLVISMIVSGLFGPLSIATRLINLIITLAIAYPAYALSAKRFQDRNKSGALAAILVGIAILLALLQLFGLTGNPVNPNALGIVLNLALVVVGIWFLVELGILRGTIGENQYGPDPVG